MLQLLQIKLEKSVTRQFYHVRLKSIKAEPRICEKQQSTNYQLE
jgi:hypothetical protein